MNDRLLFSLARKKRILVHGTESEKQFAQDRSHLVFINILSADLLKTRLDTPQHI